MRNSLVYSICLVLLGIMGCSMNTTKIYNKRGLYLHCYVCDSLGVEKGVFGRNEKIYYGCAIKNTSKHPIKYIRCNNDSNLFGITNNEVGGKLLRMSMNSVPQEMWNISCSLKPGEELTQVTGYPPPLYLKAGRCYASFWFLTDFGPRYIKLFGYGNPNVEFTILEK